MLITCETPCPSRHDDDAADALEAALFAVPFFSGRADDAGPASAVVDSAAAAVSSAAVEMTRPSRSEPPATERIPHRSTSPFFPSWTLTPN
jgi:hypothetical protein